MARIQLRRGTAAQWTSTDPILSSGEAGVETDTGKFKLGDGTTAWTDLDYAGGSDHPDLTAHDTLGLVTQAELDTHAADTTAVHGIADTSVLATDAEVTAAVTTHEAAGNPHPSYETSTEAQAKVDAHAAASDPHPGYATDADLAGKANTSHSHVDADLPATIARDAEVTAAVSSHEAAPDPHAGYQKESEKDANSGYAGLSSSGLVPAARLGTGGDGTNFLRSDGTFADVATSFEDVVLAGDGVTLPAVIDPVHITEGTVAWEPEDDQIVVGTGTEQLAILDQRHPTSADPHAAASYAKMAGGGRQITVSDTAPEAPAGGDLWVDPDTVGVFPHQATHQTGSTDVLTGNLDAIARVAVARGGVLIGNRRKINFIQGANVSIATTDDSGGEKVDVTINATAGSGTAFEKEIFPTGALFQSCRRIQNFGNAGVLSSGRLTLVGVRLPGGMVVSSLTFVSAGTPLAGGANQWFGVFSSAASPVVLRVTADDGATAWAANSAKTLSLSSPYEIPSDGLYYIGIMINATTVPTLRAIAMTNATVPGLAPVTVGNSTGSLTTPPAEASTVATPVAITDFPYFYGS